MGGCWRIDPLPGVDSRSDHSIYSKQGEIGALAAASPVRGEIFVAPSTNYEFSSSVRSDIFRVDKKKNPK
jgi:hypothetical protein